MRVLLFALALGACGDQHLSIEPDCNPLGFGRGPYTSCMVPWPSSAFEVADSSTATGRQLAIPSGALPANFENTPIDPALWNLADGFSPAAPMIMAFPGGVSDAGLPSVDDLDPSLTADSPTVVIDMTTGMRVPHFAELNAQSTAGADSQALFIRPASRLVGGHRYAVAITNRVKAAGGGDLPVPPGFAALRDGTKTDDARLEAMRGDSKAVLDALDAAGFAKADLVVAWDFTVASDDFLHREMIAARDRAVAATTNHPLAYKIITDQQPDRNAGIARYITGTLDAPLFLTTGSVGVAGTTTVRDSDNLPVVQGFYQIPFAAIVPDCALTSPTPVPMILYGHGLLGDSTEVDCCGVPPVAVDLCMVIVGTDMRGMSQADTGAVAAALNDGTKSDGVFEVLEQGIANHVVLAEAMRTTMAQTLFVDGTGKVLVDPDQVFYWGLSQGGIFGASVMAYEPTITRGVLGSGAANYSFLLDRSADWTQYQTILEGAYPDPLDDELLIGLMQMRWDKTEPAGIANGVLAGTETGVPAKQLLMQIAFADEQVSDFAAYWEVRSMNVPVMATTVTAPWGITMQDASQPASTELVIYDCGAPAPPTTNTAPPKFACAHAGTSELHDLPAHVPAGRRQMKNFYATGQITNECAGACTCATGACD